MMHSTNGDDTSTPRNDATGRVARLRLVLEALRRGAPTGERERIAELLDRADRARELADEQLEIARALLEELSE